MKKVLVLLWTIVMSGILLFLMISYFTKSNNKTKSIPETFSETTFIPAEFDTLVTLNKYVLLAISAKGCSMCDLLRESPELKNYPLKYYSLERKYSPNNILVSQALPAKGFPTSYIFNSRGEIIGMFGGLFNLAENLNGVLTENRNICTDTIGGVKPEHMFPMLTWSFRALCSYLRNDMQGVYENARRSIKFGSYFFNDYMLYVYHNHVGNPDSTLFYKNMALNSLNGTDIFIYESLVRELDPQHPMLEWIPEEDHVHDENCGHENGEG